MKKIKLKIELLSELCSGAGVTSGSSVDTDITKDENGFPYIPAKRLKGLLLEAFLDYNDIFQKNMEVRDYFGEEDGSTTVFFISNAKLINNSLRQDQYFSQKTQTAIGKNGISLDKSLRTMNVINKGVVFECFIETLLELTDLENICKLVKHMGTNRTRGSGEVKLTVESLEINNEFETKAFEDELLYSVKFNVVNTSDLLIASNDKNTTKSYIPGASLLGFFAHKFLKENNNDMELFEKIFLENNVFFSNGYISDEDFNQFYPIPKFINKDKRTNTYYNRLIEDSSNDGEVKLKPVGDGYCIYENDAIKIEDVTLGYSYHHARDKANIGNGALVENAFFQYLAIETGQNFTFTLTGKGKYLSKIVNSNLDKIRVGRSKTAQYGELLVKDVIISKVNVNMLKTKKALLVLDSDLIILGDKGYSTNVEELKVYLSRKFNITINKLANFSLEATNVGGFNTLWKLPKISINAIKKGSYVEIESNEEFSIPESGYLGQKNNEGYGKYHIAEFKNREIEKISASKEEKVVIKLDSEKIYEYAINHANEINLGNFTPTFIGRLALFLKNSENYEEFRANTESIKDVDKLNNFKTEILKRYDNIKNEFNDSENKLFRKYFLTLFSLLKYKGRKKDEA